MLACRNRSIPLTEEIKVKVTSIHILPGRMTVVGKKYIVAIYYRHPARQVNGSIYIQTKLSQTTNLIMP